MDCFDDKERCEIVDVDNTKANPKSEDNTPVSKIVGETQIDNKADMTASHDFAKGSNKDKIVVTRTQHGTKVNVE